MKKIIVGIAFFGVIATAQIGRAAEYGTAGCGLGSMIFGSQPGIVQTFAVTTNNTFYSQLIGLTFGVSNCGPGLFASNNTRLNQFMASNLDAVAKEMAIGKGESLDAMAELMEIPTEERAMVYGTLQSHYSDIFTSESVQTEEVLDHIAMVIKK